MQLAPALWSGVVPGPRAWQVRFYDKLRQHWIEGGQPAVLSAIMGAGKTTLVAEISAGIPLGMNEVILISTSSERLVNDVYAEVRRRTLMVRTCGRYFGKAKEIAQIVVVCMPSMNNCLDELERRGKRVAVWIADEAHKTEQKQILQAHRRINPYHVVGVTATPFRADEKETVSLFEVCLDRYGVDEATRDGVIVPWKVEHYNGDTSDLDTQCHEMMKDAVGPGVCNATSKRDADGYAKFLTSKGFPAMPFYSGQSAAAQDRIIQAAKSGEIRCIVHVAMLVEGVNFPWLHWMMLRREVGSRVRFVQEIGRLLRTYPGKYRAIYFDPHDLFGSFTLACEEALGAVPPLPPPVKRLALQVGDAVSEVNPAIRMEMVESIVRNIFSAAESEGICRRIRIIRRADRVGAGSSLQYAAIRSAIDGIRPEKYVPPEWRAALPLLAQSVDNLRYGYASDFILALSGIKSSKRWPTIDEDGTIGGEPVRDVPTVREPDGQLKISFASLAAAEEEI